MLLAKTSGLTPTQALFLKWQVSLRYSLRNLGHWILCNLLQRLHLSPWASSCLSSPETAYIIVKKKNHKTNFKFKILPTQMTRIEEVFFVFHHHKSSSHLLSTSWIQTISIYSFRRNLLGDPRHCSELSKECYWTIPMGLLFSWSASFYWGSR